MSGSDGWPVKLMCSDYPGYRWPYGTRALIAERANVGKVLELSARMNYGWHYGGNYEPIFKVPLSFHEGFVSNDNERLKLIDRVRTYHNFNWKRDVCTHAHPQVNSPDGGITKSEKHYATLINNLIEMQALTEELKIETLALVVSCTNAHELEQAMLNACA
jgi:hypothetical protein